MRKKILVLTVLAFLAGLASADLSSRQASIQPGEILTLSVRDLPEETETVAYSLTESIRGLLMHKQADGGWEGKFAILPSMAGRALQPVVTARLKNGESRILNLPLRKVGTESDLKSGDGFVTVAEDGTVIFVFDSTIRLDTVKVLSESGSELKARYENNYFRLSEETSFDEVSVIRAKSIRGESLEIETGQSVRAAFDK